MDAHWVKLGEGIPVTFEIRLKRPFTPQEEIVSGEKVEGPTWIIAAAYPEKAEDGSVSECSLNALYLSESFSSIVCNDSVPDILCILSTYPLLNSYIVGILGCITDISRQKWTEGFQKRKKMEAIELKRQQENFIDMTSQYEQTKALFLCMD